MMQKIDNNDNINNNVFLSLIQKILLSIFVNVSTIFPGWQSSLIPSTCCLFLEVKLPYEPVSPSVVRWLDGRSVGQNFTFHAPVISVSVSICLFVYLSTVCVSVCEFVCECMCVCVSVCLYLSINKIIYLSIFLSIYI